MKNWINKLVEGYQVRRFLKDPTRYGYLVRISTGNPNAFFLESVPFDPFLGDTVLRRTTEFNEFLTSHDSAAVFPQGFGDYFDYYFYNKEDAVLAKLMFGDDS